MHNIAHAIQNATLSIGRAMDAASQFLSVLSSFNLIQHVNFPTHSKNHILDLGHYFCRLLSCPISIHPVNCRSLCTSTTWFLFNLVTTHVIHLWPLLLAHLPAPLWKSLFSVWCTLSMEWTPHWSSRASSDTVSCTFTYHTWQFGKRSTKIVEICTHPN